MKLLIQSAMIFFGTLLAAAFVALGEPAQADVAVAGAEQAAARGAHPAARDRGPWFESVASKGSSRQR